MSKHKLFAIKHKQTGKLMPSLKARRTAKCATAWNPAEVNNKRRAPRLFETDTDAWLAANCWELANGDNNQLIVVPVTITEDLLEW